jgi:hypothetical protein
MVSANFKQEGKPRAREFAPLRPMVQYPELPNERDSLACATKKRSISAEKGGALRVESAGRSVRKGI